MRNLVIELGNPGLDPTVFHHILRYKPAEDFILPNMETLKVVFHRRVDFDHSALFIGANVKKLHLCLPKEDVEHLETHLGTYASRMPNLSHLEIDSTQVDFPMAKIQRFLLKWISGLRGLEHFVCAPYLATPEVLSALFRIPSLRTIGIGTVDFKGAGQVKDVLQFCPSLPAEGLGSIETLSFCSDYGDAAKLLDAMDAPKLKYVTIAAATVVTADSLHRLLSVLGKRYSGIRTLSLEAARYVTSPLRQRRFGDSEDLDVVTLSVLRPLLRFAELEALRISYHRPFRVTDSDLEKIVAGLPYLTVLDFCADPVLAKEPLITAAIIPIISQRCPNISDLALYIDSRAPDPSLAPSNAGYRVELANVRKVRFGTSPIAEDDVFGFASYLSKFLRPDCEIDGLADIRWLDRKEVQEYRSNSLFNEIYSLRWNHVSSLLKILVMVWEEKRNVQNLSSRADALGARVSVVAAEGRRRLSLIPLC